MLTLLSGFVVVGALFVAQGKEPERRQSVPIEVPDLLDCIEDYHRVLEKIVDTADRGDPDAILCLLAFESGQDRPDDEFGLRYRYFRATGYEPEGMDELLQRYKREELARQLIIIHDMSGELESFPVDYRYCTHYDPIAVKLLLRVEPLQSDRCMP